MHAMFGSNSAHSRWVNMKVLSLNLRAKVTNSSTNKGLLLKTNSTASKGRINAWHKQLTRYVANIGRLFKLQGKEISVEDLNRNKRSRQLILIWHLKHSLDWNIRSSALSRICGRAVCVGPIWRENCSPVHWMSFEKERPTAFPFEWDRSWKFLRKIHMDIKRPMDKMSTDKHLYSLNLAAYYSEPVIT